MERLAPRINQLPSKIISLKCLPVAGPGRWRLLFRLAGMTLDVQGAIAGMQAGFWAEMCP
jgi:hypothetical protein